MHVDRNGLACRRKMVHRSMRNSLHVSMSKRVKGDGDGKSSFDEVRDGARSVRDLSHSRLAFAWSLNRLSSSVNYPTSRTALPSSECCTLLCATQETTEVLLVSLTPHLTETLYAPSTEYENATTSHT